MISLLSCANPRVDDWDPYEPSSPRRGSRTFSLVRTPSKRKAPKMSIGSPENFRHDFHLGKDILLPADMDLWNANWLEDLRAKSMTSTPSTKSTVHSSEPSTTSPLATPRALKRCSITPQKRKPVPSIVPDLPISPFDIPLPPSPIDASPAPLVPLLDNAGDTPYVTHTVKARWDTAIGEIADALRESDYS